MAGNVRNVITRRVFNLSNVGGSSTQDIPLVRGIDVSSAKAIDMVVRVHAATVGASGTIVIHARAISLTNEEPDVDFTNTVDLATATIDPTVASAAPTLVLETLTPPFGHMITLFLRGTQPASPVTLSATLSIDLVTRDN